MCSPVIADWQNSLSVLDLSSRFCVSKSPRGQLSYAPLTIFADDMSKLLICQEPQEASADSSADATNLIKCARDCLDGELASAGIAQDRDEADISPTFIGHGSFREQHTFVHSLLPNPKADIWAACRHTKAPMQLRWVHS